MEILVYIIIGIVTGAVVGFMGIAGGVIVIPGLVYLAGFSQKMAVGTNLFLLMLPISIAAGIENYRQGNVNLKAVLFIGVTTLIVAFLASKISSHVNQNALKIGFGCLMVVMGAYMIVSTALKMK